MKTCRQCFDEKPLSEFYRNRGMADRHLNICKPCVIEKAKARQRNNPEKASAYALSYYYRNKERCCERQRRYYITVPDLVKARVQSWKRDNPMAVRAFKQKRRARVLGAEGQYTTADWLAIVERQHGKCLHCDITCKLTVDHIVPLSKGGSNWPSNLQGLCAPCNSRKGNRIEQ